MTAAARRYNGKYKRVPARPLLQIWNEPNLRAYLTPVADAKGNLRSPGIYRGMVNAAYDAIHAVKRDNVVIAGGTSPFGNDDASIDEISPLLFMRKLLCLSTGTKPKAVCKSRVRFDVWGTPPVHVGRADHPPRPEEPRRRLRPTCGR